VFDSSSKPWVNPDGADAMALGATVERCPSGALQMERRAGIAAPLPAANTATLTSRGPTYLRGDLVLLAQDGSVALSDTRMALCRCGGSQNKPFCDGSHAKQGFADDGGLRAGATPSIATAGGRLEIRARPAAR
jgi:CDGSH-type Zn-finger protein